MGRDLAYRTFARMMAVLGLTAVIAAGFSGLATAAPADRATDPVVMKGSALPGFGDVKPQEIVAFKWEGKWTQIPVQVDERHAISARSLYPDKPVGYVNGHVGVDSDVRTFEIEVYADPKTRSGADADSNFDADDELVFMGGDSGQDAPASALAPEGVDAASATKVAVKDPNGGESAFVYLFRSTGDLDPSAGKDYVDYDFKLTNFGPKDTLIDNYGFTNTGNPEDSTVKTANYELHSVDRWMEDKIKITAGGASGTDILDREGVSAGGLGGCTRSEYTFSANWTMDTTSGNDSNTDDEGTYVNVIDGPVRAIRSYMGANSGPYVEDVHTYYADREDRTVFVRVHPIPEMYVWTDYNSDAVGMTYRDEKNQAGFAVDGNPDTPVPATMADFENGKYLWQQVSGPQGTATTLVTANSSATPEKFPSFLGFKGYYLDDTTPVGPKEKQCGGDLKAYGASGFGIDGVYPNTDPIFGVGAAPEKLSVNRIRYFGGPNETAADAEALRVRAQDPLTAEAASATVKARAPKLSVKLQGKKPKAKPGKKLKIKLRISNTGTADAAPVKICVSGSRLPAKVCKNFARIFAGKAATVVLSPKVKKGKKSGKVKLKVTVTSGKVKAGTSLSIPVRS